MSISAGDALTNGVEDVASERGLALYAIYVVFGLVNAVVTQNLVVRIFELVATHSELRWESLEQARQTGAFGFDLGLSLGTSAALALVSLLAGPLLAVVAIRSFASESREPIPTEEVTRSLAGTYLSLVAASVLAGLIVLGVVGAFVLPGVLLSSRALTGLGVLAGALVALVLGLLFYFIQQAVAVGDASAIGALSESVDVVKANVVPVLVVVAVLAVVSFAVTTPVGFLPVGADVSLVLSTLLGQIATVYGIAVATDAYQQATGETATEEVGGV